MGKDFNPLVDAFGQRIKPSIPVEHHLATGNAQLAEFGRHDLEWRWENGSYYIANKRNGPLRLASNRG